MLAFLAGAEIASLSLTCTGYAGVQAVQNTQSAVVTDNRGNAAYANGATTAPATVELTSGFELTDGHARVFLPAVMRPAMSSTKDGWFPVDNLVITDERITGSVKLNFMRSTTIEIDRATGVMTTKHGYRAECAAIDRTKKKF